jgi:hypothetical protein
MAAGRSAILSVKVIADTLQAQLGLDKVGKSTEGASKALGSLALPAGLAFAGVVAFGKGAGDAASEVEQAFGAVDSVFKDNADTVKGWARQSADSVGLSSSAYAQMAAVLGSQLKNMGTSVDELAPKTDELIKLGADLAATYGGTTADAVAALSSLMRGERDPIEKYGVSVKQAGIDAEASALGFKKTGAQYDANAQLLATLSIVSKQTADAQGQFARESDTASHAQQVANAAWEDGQAALGEALLPVLVTVAGVMRGLAGFITENKDAVMALLVVVGSLSAAILAANAALTAWNLLQNAARVAAAAWTAVQTALNLVLSLNPIGLIVIAIAALVAAIVLAYTKSETFRKVVDAAFQAVLKVVQTVIGVIVNIFRTLGPILLLPFRIWLLYIQVSIRIILAIIQAILPVVQRVFGILVGVLKGPFETLRSVVVAVFATVGRIIGTGVDALRRLFGTLGAILSGPFDAFLRTVRRVVDAVGALFRGLGELIGKIFGTIQRIAKRIGDVIDSLPKLPDIKLPFTATAPPVTPVLRGLTRAGAIPVGTAGGSQVTLVLDREVFGRATIASIRRYDRRNGPAQVIPRWS